MARAHPFTVEPRILGFARDKALGFGVRHLGVATVHGRFESFAGRLEARDGELQVEGQVDVASVVTGNRIRDDRLRSEFFDAERHPSSSLCASCTARDGRLVGELTIRGVTRPVELTANVGPGSAGALYVRAEGSIRRSDFGLDWGALREADRLLIADGVRITADVVLTPTSSPDTTRADVSTLRTQGTTSSAAEPKSD